ncbi:MAG: hypothetical protein JO316_09880 [Abitibacteriaceae bacterium]|nr:hypothetical protein [Abditibacteriaceae bacterium]
MTASALIGSLQERSISLRVEGDRLLAQPKAALTDADRISIRRHKAELMDMLTKQLPVSVTQFFTSPLLEPYVHLVRAAEDGRLSSGAVWIPPKLKINSLARYVLTTASEIQRMAPTESCAEKLRGVRRDCLITLLDDLAPIDCWWTSAQPSARIVE